jgi:glyoxylase I family protein
MEGPAERENVRPLAVHHVAVKVSDLARAEAFYVGILGLPVLRRWTDDNGEARSVWVSLGPAFLAIERAGESAPRRTDVAPGFHCIALAIAREERASWKKRLAGAGFPVESESAYTLYVRDPDDNLVAFSHYPDAADELS